MPTRMIVAFDNALPADATSNCRQLCATFATVLDAPILVAGLDIETLDEMRAWTVRNRGAGTIEGIDPPAAAGAAMTAPPFVYGDDGRPDWGAMWGSFCDLALHGGPPHRGADDPVVAPDTDAPAPMHAVLEIARGVYETTGLYAAPAPPGWLAVSCHSRRMAAWMCAAIILENVDARCDGETLYVPAGAAFELKDEVKSVITVVAKVNHYWQAHIAAQEAASSRH